MRIYVTKLMGIEGLASGYSRLMLVKGTLLILFLVLIDDRLGS